MGRRPYHYLDPADPAYDPDWDYDGRAIDCFIPNFDGHELREELIELIISSEGVHDGIR